MTDIIDGHIHLWDTAVLDYPWLQRETQLPRQAVGSDLRLATATEELPGRFVTAIAVQAECDTHQATAEVKWLAKQREDGAPIRGIVAYAPLEGDSFGPILEQYAEDPLVVGVRRNIQDEQAGFTKRVEDRVRELCGHGLTFDICARGHQLNEVISLVDSAPNTSFVLDHLGKPPFDRPENNTWHSQIDELALRSNVACNLSGLATEAGPGSTPQEILLHIAHAVNAFGLDRVLFGSDWPVCTTSVSYASWVNLVWDAIPPEAQSAVFGGNAATVYNIEQGTGNDA